MEKKLRQLFDCQKLVRNPRLDAMLGEAESRCHALEDDDLGLVSAAGDVLDNTMVWTESTNNVGALMVEDLSGFGESAP
jgi:hypothetical protein